MAIGNIQGGPFQDWVTNQIEQRQLSLGKSAAKYNPETGTVIGKQNQDLLYQQTKAPWLRLASSVNLTKKNSFGILDRLLTLPDISLNDIEGDLAARNFILQGGALSIDINDNITLNSGLNTTALNTSNANNLSGAYGWGGTTERGFIPMPGITSASVKYENDGALTKTTINIKCYSRTQFALIDALYMRPGYTLLLEFGWSAYLQTNSNNQLLTGDQVSLQNQDPFFSPALSLLLNNKRKTQNNQYKIIQKIKEERERTSGNYEAVFGKIVNFKWSMDPDGSYNCVVELRGLGEMIESLRLNVNTKTDESKIDKDAQKITEAVLKDEDQDTQIPLVAAAQSGGTLIENLFAIYQNEKQKTGELETDWFDGVSDSTGQDLVSSYTITNFPVVSNTGGFQRKSVTFKNSIVSLTKTTVDLDNFTPQVYIKFGVLLALIQKNIIPCNGGGAPNYIFDMDFENLGNDKNFIRRYPGQFPITPFKFLIPYDNHQLNSFELKYKIELPDLVEFPSSANANQVEFNKLLRNSGWVYNKYLGRLANVMVNVNHVGQILLDMKGKINNIQRNEKDLFAFLKQLMTELNIGLGSINNVKIKIPNEGERIKFVEEIPQTFAGDPPVTYKNKICKFNTLGFSTSSTENRQGSIVKNLSIDASIPSNYSTMISIGAQSNGNQASGNSTSFSNYNNGIVDRVIPRKILTDKDQKIPEAQIQLQKMVDSLKELNSKGWWSDNFLTKITTADGGLWADIFRDRQWYGDDMETFTNLGTTYHQILNGIYTQPPSKGGLGVMEAPFFLPFNLSLDIDGISGIVMMQRFEIDQKVLPPSYDKDSVEIIVKSVDHEVNKDSWTTKLGTQSVPKIRLNRASKINALKKGNSGGATSKSKGKVFKRAVGIIRDTDPINALRRMEITLLQDVRYGVLGVLTVFAEDEITVLRRFALKVGFGNVLSGGGGIETIPSSERFLCQFDSSQKYENAVFFYANNSNNYDFNNIIINNKGPVKNLLMVGEVDPYGNSNSEIHIGSQFQSHTDEAQISRAETGLGTYYKDPTLRQQVQEASNSIKQLIANDNGEWYCDIRDERGNRNIAGISGKELKNDFLQKLRSNFPNDAIKLYPPKNSFNVEAANKAYRQLSSDVVRNSYSSTTCCFVAGTKITLVDGNYKNIEDIIVGDEVVGWKDGKLSNSIVTELKPTLLGNRFLYNINDFKITFTDEHPFLTKDGWKSIVPDEGTDYGILKVGDIINKDNKWTQIKEISKIQENFQYDTPVYNFTVKDIHSYIADDIIVHNK